MNTHTDESAAPPAKIAGPRLLAGFMLVPVKWIPRRCTSVRVRPITRPAILLKLSRDVTPRIASTNTKVRIISTRIERPTLL